MTHSSAPPKNRLLLLIAVFVYIDLLFLPYFQAVIMPVSLPLVFGALLWFGHLRIRSRFFTPFLILSGLLMTSYLIGLFVPQAAPYMAENLKRVIQFLTSFFYLFFFYRVAMTIAIEQYLKRIAVVFLIYFMILVLLFANDPDFVNSLMRDLYGRLVTDSEVARIHLRFAYLFSDPNTAGYFVSIAVLPWLMVFKKRLFKVVVITACIVAVVLVQSRGALLGLMFAILYWGLPWHWFKYGVNRREFTSYFGISIFMVTIGVVALFYFFPNLNDIPLYDISINRVTDSESYIKGGSRFEIWTKYVTILPVSPIGIGYMFDTEAGKFFPHSDFFRFFYSYGYIAAFVVTFWLARETRHFPLLLFPALLAFFVNTLIDEQKLFGLFLATLGVMYGMSYRFNKLRMRSYIK